MFEKTSKCFNYIDAWITPGYFGLFIVVWAYLRHYINLVILSSLLPNGQFATVGPYDLNWDTQQYKCWISQVITFALLAVLQAVNVFWFVLIIRILVRFLSTSEAKDERSEDEDENELEPVDSNVATPHIELNGEPFSPIEAPGTGSNKAGLRKR